MPYIGKSPGNGVRQRYIYAATAGQTSFSGNDSAGISLVYDDPSYLDVYQNGVLLKPVTDYASTTGTSVVLVTGATTDDVVEMITYDTFAIADTVSAKDGGSFAGAVSMASTLAVTGAVTAASTLAVTGTTTIGDGTSGVAKINGGSSSSGQLIFMDAGTNRARIGVPTGTTTLSLSGSNSLTGDIVITADGEVTMPTQPAFLVFPSSNTTNIAINTNLTVAFATEVFDVGANFASNTFTAPITGKYLLAYSLYLEDIDIDTQYYQPLLNTSNRSYYQVIATNFSADLEYFSFSQAVVADMDANDTAYIVFRQQGGTQQADIDTEARFSGFLAC